MEATSIPIGRIPSESASISIQTTTGISEESEDDDFDDFESSMTVSAGQSINNLDLSDYKPSSCMDVMNKFDTSEMAQTDEDQDLATTAMLARIDGHRAMHRAHSSTNISGRYPPPRELNRALRAK